MGTSKQFAIVVGGSHLQRNKGTNSKKETECNSNRVASLVGTFYAGFFLKMRHVQKKKKKKSDMGEKKHEFCRGSATFFIPSNG